MSRPNVSVCQSAGVATVATMRRIAITCEPGEREIRESAARILETALAVNPTGAVCDVANGLSARARQCDKASKEAGMLPGDTFRTYAAGRADANWRVARSLRAAYAANVRAAMDAGRDDARPGASDASDDRVGESIRLVHLRAKPAVIPCRLPAPLPGPGPSGADKVFAVVAFVLLTMALASGLAAARAGWPGDAGRAVKMWNDSTAGR